MNYDVVICVGWNDLTIVKKTIEYVRKNLDGKNIYLIVNSFYFSCFSSSFIDKYKIVLIDEDLLIPGVSYKQNREFIERNRPGFAPGWYYQQFLKMAFSQSEYASDYYLIWDADTLPLSKIKFEENGKLMFTAKKEYHEEYFITIDKLFGLKKVKDYSFISEHMLIKTDIMKEIISKISGGASEPWPYILLRQVRPEAKGGFSEFETYGTYVSCYYPELYTERNLNTWRNAGFVFGRAIKEKYIQYLSAEFDIISLESWSGLFFIDNVKAKIQELYLKYLRYKYLRLNKVGVSEKQIFHQIMNFFRKGKIVKF